MHNGKTDLLILVYLHKWNMDAYFKRKQQNFCQESVKYIPIPLVLTPFCFFSFKKRNLFYTVIITIEEEIWNIVLDHELWRLLKNLSVNSPTFMKSTCRILF